MRSQMHRDINSGFSVTLAWMCLVLCCMYSGVAAGESSFDEGEDTELGDGFFRRIELDAATTLWLLQVENAKGTDEDSDWSRVTTEEDYTLQPLRFYSFRGKFETQYFDLTLQYQTDRGLTVGEGTSSYFDLIASLSQSPLLHRFSLYYLTLDFEQGEARLLDRETKAVLDSTTFKTRMEIYELRFQINMFRLWLRLQSYAMPRNVYLQECIGEGEYTSCTYFQISDRLMKLKTKFGQFGTSLDNRERKEVDGFLVEMPDRRNWILGASFGYGFGPYELRSLDFDNLIDDGVMMAVTGAVNLGFQFRLFDALTLGGETHIYFTIMSLGSLSERMENRFRAQGIDPEDLALETGAVDVLASYTAFARIEF